MKVTYNWLKEFVEIKISPQALADKLTMAGLEVTSLEKSAGDFIFEIEVTSNRPDCLSVIGLAREVAAITNKKFNVKSLMFNAKNIKHSTLNIKQLSIKIENKKDCPLYTARIIKDVKVGPSPAWLKKRLELIGCRSVNNIVDITNYILFTWGEPLHAFDLDKLKQDIIIVRRAKNNEKITTIDEEERALNSDVLVIADKAKAIAIAGIMGGRETEVSEETKNILLEAAIFNPIIVRRSRQRLGLQSESGYRFERGVDPEIVEFASAQATKLIQELAGGRCVVVKSLGLAKRKKKSINLKVATVNKILGTKVAPLKIKKILDSLGFKIKPKAKNNFTVKVPSHRLDINQDVDLIEEIARIFGYENISVTLPLSKPQLTSEASRSLGSEIKNILVGLGLNEVITYSLIDRGLLKGFDRRGGLEAIAILNPLSKEQEILRPQLIPSLGRSVACNLNQKQDYIDIFEVSNVFGQCANKIKEEPVLGIALCGIKSIGSEQGLIKERLGFLHLKGILETLFKRLGIQDYNFAASDPNAVAIYIKQDRLGSILRLTEDTLDNLEIKNKEVWAAEILLERLFSRINLSKRLSSLPIYPGISRDISLILKEEVAVGEVLKLIKEKGLSLLKEAKIIDCYKGKQIPLGYKGLTVSCLYRCDTRTLTESEINPLHLKISAALVDKFGAEIRA